MQLVATIPLLSLFLTVCILGMVSGAPKKKTNIQSAKDGSSSGSRQCPKCPVSGGQTLTKEDELRVLSNLDKVLFLTVDDWQNTTLHHKVSFIF